MNIKLCATIAAFTLPLIIAAASPVSAIANTAPAQTVTPPATLSVTFADIEETKGAIMLAIFDSEASYNGGKPVRGVMVPVSAATAATIIEGLPAGRYAFKLLHDLDGDGKMATNPFGIPTEPYAFSNNAVGSMGPAKWTDAAFDLAGPTTQQITFR